jgi:nuclear GTP-binding protein
VLSDWVRGRIPYFVPPPERPEELNEIEAKKVRKDLKGKGKAVDAELPGVTQNLKSLVQKNTFISEDIQQLDAEFEVHGEDEQSSAQEDVEERDVSETDDVELKWTDVFDNPVASEAANTGAGDNGIFYSE